MVAQPPHTPWIETARQKTLAEDEEVSRKGENGIAARVKPLIIMPLAGHFLIFRRKTGKGTTHSKESASSQRYGSLHLLLYSRLSLTLHSPDLDLSDDLSLQEIQ
jgi:hypothetical protein